MHSKKALYVVYPCCSVSGPEEVMPFIHEFPKDRKQIKKWIEALNQIDWEPNIWSKICSIHFLDSSIYFSKKGICKLTSDAVPSLFINQTPSERLDHTEPSTSESNVIKKQKDQINNVSISPSVSNITGTPTERKLKKEIIRLADIAKRRGTRVKTLSTLCNRLKMKIKNLSQIIKELTGNQPRTS